MKHIVWVSAVVMTIYHYQFLSLGEIYVYYVFTAVLSKPAVKTGMIYLMFIRLKFEVIGDGWNEGSKDG